MRIYKPLKWSPLRPKFLHLMVPFTCCLLTNASRKQNKKDTYVIILQCVFEAQYQHRAVTSHKIPIMVGVTCSVWKQRQEDGMFCLLSLNKVEI